MLIDFLALWIIFFIIFLLMSLIEKRGPVFGIISGIWLIFIGIGIYLTGIQYQSGMTILTTGATQAITYQYTQFISPFSDLKTIWCIPFWGIGIYISFAAATAKRTK